MSTPALANPDWVSLPAVATAPPATIVLCTLNARYMHASLGLRYLLANMGAWQTATSLLELTINRPTTELLTAVLQRIDAHNLAPGGKVIVGFGVYIWNTVPTHALILALKAARPGITVVLGGPEVSHETDQQAIVHSADYVITGWGDISFPKLCTALIHGPKPLMKIIPGAQPALEQIALPYAHYTDEDIAHRLIYVEASRGCPFKCEFCLSSLDKTAWAFEQDRFLAALDDLYQRGVRQFKFVDRTFNLKIDASARVLQFFLDRLSTPQGRSLFAHFELIPDQLPERLKVLIAQFPPGSLQFEIGIQTFNPEVQQRISRRQDDAKTADNLQWLVQQSHAHLHTDLIFGLPGESLDSFAQGFDRLMALQPHEIQLGILKRLRGTPIARHTKEHGMVYEATPPYAVQRTAVVTSEQMQAFTRLARYWDLLANSGRFKRSMALVFANEQAMGGSAFWRFWHLSEQLYAHTKATHGLTPERLVDFMAEYLRQLTWATPEGAITNAHQALLEDYLASGAKGKPQVFAAVLSRRRVKQLEAEGFKAGAKRQDQHLRGDRA